MHYGPFANAVLAIEATNLITAARIQMRELKFTEGS
jgi:hypothetical protein